MTALRIRGRENRPLLEGGLKEIDRVPDRDRGRCTDVFHRPLVGDDEIPVKEIRGVPPAARDCGEQVVLAFVRSEERRVGEVGAAECAGAAWERKVLGG